MARKCARVCVVILNFLTGLGVGLAGIFLGGLGLSDIEPEYTFNRASNHRKAVVVLVFGGVIGIMLIVLTFAIWSLKRPVVIWNLVVYAILVITCPLAPVVLADNFEPISFLFTIPFLAGAGLCASLLEKDTSSRPDTTRIEVNGYYMDIPVDTPADNRSSQTN